MFLRNDRKTSTKYLVSQNEASAQGIIFFPGLLHHAFRRTTISLSYDNALLRIDFYIWFDRKFLPYVLLNTIRFSGQEKIKIPEKHVRPLMWGDRHAQDLQSFCVSVPLKSVDIVRLDCARFSGME